MTQGKYLITKDGKYLTSILGGCKFTDDKDNAYRYNVRMIAEDVARQTGATVEESLTWTEVTA